MSTILSTIIEMEVTTISQIQTNIAKKKLLFSTEIGGGGI
jgi:hypothetical protein